MRSEGSRFLYEHSPVEVSIGLQIKLANSKVHMRELCGGEAKDGTVHTDRRRVRRTMTVLRW